MHENNGTTAIMSDTRAEQVLERSPAARVTKDHLESIIADRKFIRATDVLTICVLTLANGFTVIGESACASPENYDQGLGEKYAYEKAFEKLWAFEGYLLRQRLYEQAAAAEPTNEDRAGGYVIGEGFKE